MGAMKKQSLIKMLENFCDELSEPEKSIFRTDYSQGLADGANDVKKIIIEKIKTIIKTSREDSFSDECFCSSDKKHDFRFYTMGHVELCEWCGQRKQ